MHSEAGCVSLPTRVNQVKNRDRKSVINIVYRLICKDGDRGGM